MGLQEEVDAMRSEIRTDEYAMSIGEWMNLYENDELDVHPEFQRFYRWTELQKTQLIESLLLGIPIPTIFVSQRDDGVWDVVDGVQRLSTIFEFAGILKGENEKELPKLKLQGTKYLPSLEGIVWESKKKTDKSLAPTLRLQLKRSKIGVSIILKESDRRSKFDLFQRLNRGGSQLSDQEVRNCILVMHDEGFYNWVRELASDQAFIQAAALTEKATEEQYDMELVLRFVLLRTLPEEKLSTIGDISEFITEKMLETASDPAFDRETEGELFRRTFSLLNDALEGNAFRRFDQAKSKFLGGFLISGFEAVALGLGWNIDTPPPISEMEGLIQSIWNRDDFRQNSGGGIRASTRIPRVVPIGRRVFAGNAKRHG